MLLSPRTTPPFHRMKLANTAINARYGDSASTILMIRFGWVAALRPQAAMDTIARM